MALGAFVLEDKEPTLSQLIGQGIGSGLGLAWQRHIQGKEGQAAGKFLGYDEEKSKQFGKMNPEMQKAVISREKKGVEKYDPEKLNKIIDMKLGILDPSQLTGDSPEAVQLAQKRDFMSEQSEMLISTGVPVNTSIIAAEGMYNALQQQNQQVNEQIQAEKRKAQQAASKLTVEEGLELMETDEEKFQFLTNRGFTAQDAGKIITGEVNPDLKLKEEKQKNLVASFLSSLPANAPEFMRDDIINTMIQLKAANNIFTEDGVQKLMQAGVSEYMARSQLEMYRPATDEEIQAAKVEAGYNEAKMRQILRSRGLTIK